jgi:hypothetical protein
VSLIPQRPIRQHAVFRRRQHPPLLAHSGERRVSAARAQGSHPPERGSPRFRRPITFDLLTHRACCGRLRVGARLGLGSSLLQLLAFPECGLCDKIEILLRRKAKSYRFSGGWSFNSRIERDGGVATVASRVRQRGWPETGSNRLWTGSKGEARRGSAAIRLAVS